MNKLMLTALAAGFAANIAHAQSVVFTDGVLTDGQGRTLYTFDKDADNKSNCYGGCATAWPPFIAKEADRAGAGFSMITRDDGGKQFAMNGKPLYYFAADTKAGDVKGDGQGGVWHVVRGAGQRAQSRPAAQQSAAPAAGYGY